MVDDDTDTFGWGVAILPYIEQQPLYQNIDAYFNNATPINGNGKAIMLLKTTLRPNPLGNVDSWVSGGTAQQPWHVDATAQQPFTKQFLPAFFCPSSAFPRFDNEGYGTSTYCGNVGSNMARWQSDPAPPGSPNVNWNGCATVKPVNQNGYLMHDNDNFATICNDMAAVLDGTSNTIMVGEVGQSRNVSPSILNNGNFPIWAGGNREGDCRGDFMGSHLRFAGGYINPNGTVTHNLNHFLNNSKGALPAGTGNPHWSDLSFGSYHPGGAQFTLGDASVRFIPQTINYAVYSYMGGRNDGQPVQLP
jgi:hypothetical protein